MLTPDSVECLSYDSFGMPRGPTSGSFSTLNTTAFNGDEIGEIWKSFFSVFLFLFLSRSFICIEQVKIHIFSKVSEAANETLPIILTPLFCPVFHSYFWLPKWLCALFTSDYNKILIPWEKVSKTSPENSVSCCCLPFCWKSPVLRERCAPYSHP